MNKLIAAILFLAFPAVSQIVVSGGGVIAGSNPNQIVGGSITSAYTFNGPFNTVNVTNVYLASVLSNLVMTSIATNATNGSLSIHSNGGKGTNTTLYGNLQLGDATGAGGLTISNEVEFWYPLRTKEEIYVSAPFFDINSIVYVNAAFQLDTIATVNNTEVGYLDGVTAPIQDQINVRNSIYTNGVLVTGIATQLNFVSASGIRVGASQASGVVTITPNVTNIWSVGWTNDAGNNVAHTNNIGFDISYQNNGVTHNNDGFTAVTPGMYYVDARVNYILTAVDQVGAVFTTNAVDFTPSYVSDYFDKASGGSPTGTNCLHTSGMMRLVAGDRVRLKRWYFIGDGKIFGTRGTCMNVFRVGD